MFDVINMIDGMSDGMYLNKRKNVFDIASNVKLLMKNELTEHMIKSFHLKKLTIMTNLFSIRSGSPHRKGGSLRDTR